MILEVAVLDIKPGQSDRFEAAFEKAQRIIAASPGYQRHELQRSADRDDRYLLLVWWVSIESHTLGFRGSAPYQEWKRLLHHFYDPFPHVEHYIPTAIAGGTPRLMIMIAGPYKTGSDDPAVWKRNLEQMNRAALAVFKKGHMPVIGVNMALPVIAQAQGSPYDAIMRPLSLRLAEHCTAVLRLRGASNGADQEVETIRKRGFPVFTSIDEIPSAS